MSTFAPTALQDKIAIVTGGGTGIGRIIAREMAKVGAHIVVASRNPDHINPAAEEIQQLGRQSLAVTVDVRVPEQVDNLAKATMDKFGRIDILVNNHGALFQCAVEDLSPGGWNAIIGINLTGVFLCSRAVGQAMIQQKRGKIVNIVSIAGLYGSPMTAPYGAAKAGVINFTKSLAMEWSKHNIYVNAVAPGPILTESGRDLLWSSPELQQKIRQQVPLGRYGEPEEIANAVIFLASDASSYITGETLYVDGGPSLRA
ncbi:MAG TPA: glucose 1-dehydrogenase [Gammaproteobacteria bacterium]|jgi:3-oxoacyl-[acyl-carrier protein] reductase|nr:glucose 1-dehydrogenase [Gammaproteobacteria bacterium]